MTEYLQHWWNGDLVNYCESFGIDINKTNKVINLFQYFVGLLAIFELVDFAAAANKAARLSRFAIFITKVPGGILNTPRLCAQISLGILIAVIGRRPLWPMFASVLRTHSTEVVKTATDEAKGHVLVRIFSWLARHPLGETAQRWILFVAFGTLTLADILTSE